MKLLHKLLIKALFGLHGRIPRASACHAAINRLDTLFLIYEEGQIFKQVDRTRELIRYRLHYEVHLHRIERRVGAAEEILTKESSVLHGVVMRIVVQVDF